MSHKGVLKDDLRPFPTPQRAGVFSRRPLSPGITLQSRDLSVKRTRNGEATYRKSELWIAPSSSLKRTGHQSDWKLRRGESDENNKYLELADIALGLAPAKHKTKRSA